MTLPSLHALSLNDLAPDMTHKIADDALGHAIRTLDYETIISTCAAFASFHDACERRDWAHECMRWFSWPPPGLGDPLANTPGTREDFLRRAQRLVMGVQRYQDIKAPLGQPAWEHQPVFFQNDEIQDNHNNVIRLSKFDDFILLVRGGSQCIFDSSTSGRSNLRYIDRQDIRALTDALLPHAAKGDGNRLGIAFSYAVNQFANIDTIYAAAVVETETFSKLGFSFEATIDPELADKLAPFLRREHWEPGLTFLATSSADGLVKAKAYWHKYRTARKADLSKALEGLSQSRGTASDIVMTAEALEWAQFALQNGATTKTGRISYVTDLTKELHSVELPRLLGAAFDSNIFAYFESHTLWLGSPEEEVDEVDGDPYRILSFVPFWLVEHFANTLFSVRSLLEVKLGHEPEGTPRYAEMIGYKKVMELLAQQVRKIPGFEPVEVD